jgi:hypothetical protein
VTLPRISSLLVIGHVQNGDERWRYLISINLI